MNSQSELKSNFATKSVQANIMFFIYVNFSLQNFFQNSFLGPKYFKGEALFNFYHLLLFFTRKIVRFQAFLHCLNICGRFHYFFKSCIILEDETEIREGRGVL